MASDCVPPSFRGDAFTCPHCGAYAHFKWFAIKRDTPARAAAQTTEALCSRCGAATIWLIDTKTMIWPQNVSGVPLPSPDMPDEVERDYLEARSICTASPRGAAALLRLAVQKLCKLLGGSGKGINADIAALVSRGLPRQIQRALDIVRVTGNNAVHPGEMQLNDDLETVASLFELLNLIVQSQITQSRAIDEMYARLPKDALNGIQRRDAGGRNPEAP
jgi:hypothetical protein